MAANKLHSSRTTHYAFILWGDRFEEQVATIFATELRRAGVCVKLVGLAGFKATGVHGLVICCDLTLSDALQLAHQAICVVLPCSLTTIKRIENDPRIREFFKQAGENQAQFIVQSAEVMDHLLLQSLSVLAPSFAVYTDGYNLIQCACEVASDLATQVGSL
jgi:hypothetical protein